MPHPSVAVRQAQVVGCVVACAVLLAGCADTRAPVQEAPEVTVTLATPVRDPATHVVARGETLSTIARDAGVSVSTLAELNEIPNPDLIEPGLALVLEKVSPAPPAAAPRSAPAEASDPVLTWLDDRWNELQPRLTLSRRSIEQGAVAGLLLPVVVIAGIAAWLLLAGARKVLVAVARRMRLRRMPGGASEPTIPEAETTPTGRRLPGLLRRHTTSFQALVPRRSHSRALARFAAGVGARTRGTSSVLWAGVLRRTAGTSHFIAERVRVGREARNERRRHEDQEQRQAALRTQWWRPGMEALRIGLLDEAARSFEAGLTSAQAEGWAEEIELFEASLQRVAERQAGRVALSSGT